MIPADLLDLLRCPRTGQPLVVADASILARTNPPLTEALVCVDRSFAYPVLDGIPVLLAEEAIAL